MQCLREEREWNSRFTHWTAVEVQVKGSLITQSFIEWSRTKKEERH